MFLAEINRKLDLHTRLLARLLRHVGTSHMALSADVQKLIDTVAQNRNFAQSADQALGVMELMIKNLKDQISGLQPGQPIDADDLAAIQKATADLSDTNTQLQAAVPSNINTGGVDGDGNPVTPGTVSPEPGTSPGDVASPTPSPDKSA